MGKAYYDPAHVIKLFDDMAKTYGAVNLISSFGFSHLWRKKCVQSLRVEAGHQCADLMCGMGEATSLMMKSTHRPLRIEAIDFSPEMTKRCAQITSRFHDDNISVQTQNVFELEPVEKYDRICCSFGLKTFDDSQLRHFSTLIKSLLKPGGRASFVEIYVPQIPLLKAPFLFYVRTIIPLIGYFCLGNPDCYRHLAVYTEDFASRDFFASYLRDSGLSVREEFLFFGCAKLFTACRY